MSAVDEYQAATEQLAATTARDVLATYADLTTERLTPDTATLLIVAAINRANATAVALADTWLAVQIEQQTGQPVPTVGVLPVDGSERLAKAVNTVLSDAASYSRPNTVAPDQVSETGDPANSPDANAPDMRLERLARGEVFDTSQQATHDAMQQQPLVEGWVRQFDADPCQLCVWWSRGGRVWPKAHPFQRHTGCNCQPRIVVAEHIQSTEYTRRLERNL